MKNLSGNGVLYCIESGKAGGMPAFSSEAGFASAVSAEPSLLLPAGVDVVDAF